MPDHIDATVPEIEEANHELDAVPELDPSLKVVAALANELQTALANDQQKLQAAERALRMATRNH